VSEGSLQQRLVSFLRSVIPADPWQLLLLTGSVCFVVASRLSWRPPLATFSLFDAEKSQQYQAIFLRFIVPTTLLVLFAGFAGYFVCFSPGRNPVRRVLLSVMLPALAGLALALSGFISTDRPYVSILDRSLKANWSQIFHLLPWTSSPGFHFAVAGFISVGIFAVLMQLGSARLPLSLPAGQSVNAEDSALSLRVAMLIWVLMGPYLLAATIPTSFMFAILELSSWLTTPVHNSIFERASSAIQPLLYLGLACAILGRPFERTLKTSVRLFPPRYLLIAASFPTGIALVFPLTSYLSYRASWVAHNFAKTTSPHSVARFTNPDPWLSLLVISALFEDRVSRRAASLPNEAVWRAPRDFSHRDGLGSISFSRRRVSAHDRSGDVVAVGDSYRHMHCSQFCVLLVDVAVGLRPSFNSCARFVQLIYIWRLWPAAPVEGRN